MLARALLPAAVVVLVAAPALPARPPYKQALIGLFGDALPARMRDCTACHLPAKKGDDETDRPHNAFGARVKSVRTQLARAGQKTDITSRLLAVLDEDSDRDGVANGAELLAGHSPGDAADRPTAAADAQRRLAAWRTAYQARYDWRPFEPVRRPSLPADGAATHPIDAFLAGARRQRGLTPRPAAPRHVLARRLYLDLTGLPPTPAEVDAFLGDGRPDAYERLVDRLLASPRHGERWGRHWMDVWRYSDWAGYGAEVRDSQKHIWRWRDWIVESLNAGVPYDRMVQHMLAADELVPDDAGALRATGFLVRNWYRYSRNVWLDRAVEHTAKAFLGVTLNCARCHDHFYDPFAQQDYYAFRAIFEPHQVRTDAVPGVASTAVDGLPRVYDAQLQAPTYLFERGDEARPDRSKAIAPGVPAALGGSFLVRPVPLPRTAYRPDRRDFVIRDTLAASAAAVAQARQALTVARGKTSAGFFLPRDPLSAVAWSGAATRPMLEWRLAEQGEALAAARHEALTAVLAAERLEDEGKPTTQAARTAAQAQRHAALAEARWNVRQAELNAWSAVGRARAAATQRLTAARQQLAKVEAAARQPAANYTRRAATNYPATSSGRRLALARWLTHRDNPLTARVAVNHVWMRHLGQPLVPTEFDFGRNGQPPTHPALLDWLAAEFMDSGWDMKRLHRLILTSAAYRMDGGATPAMLALDPDNRLLWRFNARRAEGEVVRDSLLAVAGGLDGALGGPDIDHRQGLVVPRRSLYFQHAAEKQMEFLALFDAASVNECYRRSESVVPQQALALANSSLALAMSRRLAGELTRQAAGDEAFVRAGYRRVLQRAPTAEELALCRDFLQRQAKLLSDAKKLTPFDGGPASRVAPSADPAQRARENLIHVLMNHHEFVTIR